MPQEFQVALKHKETDIRVDYASESYKVFGLFEFLGDRPMYSIVLYDLYRFARITAVHVKMEIVNTGTTPLTATMCVLPWDVTPAGGGASLDPNAASEYPRSVTKTVGTSSGMSKATLSRTWHSFDQLGQPVYDKTYWVDYTQSGLTTPQDTREPVIYCVVDSTDPTLNWSGQVSYTVTFNCQWFDLQRDVPDELDAFEDMSKSKPKGARQCVDKVRK